MKMTISSFLGVIYAWLMTRYQKPTWPGKVQPWGVDITKASEDKKIKNYLWLDYVENKLAILKIKKITSTELKVVKNVFWEIKYIINSIRIHGIVITIWGYRNFQMPFKEFDWR